MSAAAPVEVKRASVDGRELAYFDVGDGPPVLLFHGFPDLATTFVPLADLLRQAGYRTVAPWLRGYWPSAGGDFYDVGSLVADAIGLVDSLALDRVHVVGHDWGADVAYGLAGARPDRVASATVLAVPHARALGPNRRASFEQLRLSFYMWLFQLRGIAEEIVAHDGFAFLVRLWHEWSPGWEPPHDHLKAVLETFARPGVLAAALGYYRAAFGTDAADPEYADLLAAASDIDVPTLLLVGAQDRCLLPEMAQGADVAFRGPYRAETLPGCGHFLHLEKTDEIAARALEWFARFPLKASERVHNGR